jgi:hypothetical protein
LRDQAGIDRHPYQLHERCAHGDVFGDGPVHALEVLVARDQPVMRVIERDAAVEVVEQGLQGRGAAQSIRGAQQRRGVMQLRGVCHCRSGAY